jgi:O-6-methylguanine DNA methyltransferase
MPAAMKAIPGAAPAPARGGAGDSTPIVWAALRPRRLAPYGILAVAGEEGVVSVAFTGAASPRSSLPALARRLCGPRAAERRSAERGSPALRHLEQALDELEAYFRGAARDFGVPVDLASQGTSFQRRVWAALLGIPFGSLRAYGDIAAAIGMPSSARAVGGAVGRNPVAVIVPCHRVVGRDGSLTGFSSGLPLKRILLELEGIRLRS